MRAVAHDNELNIHTVGEFALKRLHLLRDLLPIAKERVPGDDKMRVAQVDRIPSIVSSSLNFDAREAPAHTVPMATEN